MWFLLPRWPEAFQHITNPSVRVREAGLRGKGLKPGTHGDGRKPLFLHPLTSLPVEPKKHIPFSPPRIDHKIVDAITEALHSGWITTGPRTRAFERMLTLYGGHRATLCVNSASAGLELVLRWLGAGPGDEVIVPAYTYAATANVVEHCGAKVVFVDSGDDFNIAPDLIRRAVNERTKAVIPVDLAGFPCDYDEINAIVNEPEIRALYRPSGVVQEMLGRILVLSDAAHSLGGWYKGRRTGSLADVTVYSFHAVKNLTTAEGGAICLNLKTPFDNEQIYDSLSIKSLHGQNKDAQAKFRGGSWKYDIVEAGYKCNMTDIQAAMGIVELERYDTDMLPKRRRIFDIYRAAFAGDSGFIVPPFETPEKTTSFHVFLLRVNGINEEERDRIISDIYKAGVSVNVHFIPLPMMSHYCKQGYDIRQYPQAYALYACEISLPVYYNLTDVDAHRVAEAVKEATALVISQNTND